MGLVLNGVTPLLIPFGFAAKLLNVGEDETSGMLMPIPKFGLPMTIAPVRGLVDGAPPSPLLPGDMCAHLAWLFSRGLLFTILPPAAERADLVLLRLLKPEVEDIEELVD
jgi:hypothetical protein